MASIKVGQRVVDKTSGKHGKVDSFIVPFSLGFAPRTKARLVLDDGSIKDVEPHNLAIEEGYVEQSYDPVGINAQDNPNDKAEALTPAKPKRQKKENPVDEVMDEIAEATS